MCLSIDVKYHSKKKPHVAKQPILVWKWLKVLNNNYGRSPYMYTLWRFGTEYTAKFSYDNYDNVEAGLHAFFTKDAHRIRWNDYAILYPAVIPVGAKYWIGTDGEIVSTALTVYRTEQDCLKAFNATEFAKPIPRPKN
jgi:hypothetical protein